MNARRPRRYDLAWNRHHLFALLLLCAIAGAALGTRGAARPESVGVVLPVDPERIETARQLIDPNSASVGSLRRLRGIGPAKARAIVAFRQGQEGKAFACPSDLEKVHGIGSTIATRLTHDLTFAPFRGTTTRP
jgi:competence protein ComEA